MKIYIYIIYFPTSKKLNPYYVGQTAYLEKRLIGHLESKYLVGNALRKYNDWTIEILHTVKDKDAANLLEIEEIRHYNCVAPNGYNLTRGGDGAGLGNQNAKGSYSFKGCHHTEESKEKMRSAKLGKSNPAISESNRRRKGTKLEKMNGNRNAVGKRSKEFCESRKGNQAAKGSKRSKIQILKQRIAQRKFYIKRLENENLDLFNSD